MTSAERPVRPSETPAGMPVPPTIDPMATPPSPSQTGAGQASIYNVANLLTLVRIALVPVFVWLLFIDGIGWRIAALAVFIVASITDRVDGQLARKHNLVTDFGKIADPIADKALTGSALVGLSVLGELWWWVTIVILAREIGITLLRFVVIRYGVISASKGGKLKTMLQVIAITFYIAPGPIDPLRWATMGAAVIVTVVTGVDYLVKAWRLRRQTSSFPRP
ncbi:MAG: CDP-diacylglycerol/glycerol-3-phosphate3-phospha tidyltransferase [Actinomycetia bacterium]|nr:CDP-diacylglycerol/glycerol-3-phosphate3-phospha tidyltransferase [Actinomycetes bacterium]